NIARLASFGCARAYEAIIDGQTSRRRDSELADILRKGSKGNAAPVGDDNRLVRRNCHISPLRIGDVTTLDHGATCKPEPRNIQGDVARRSSARVAAVNAAPKAASISTRDQTRVGFDRQVPSVFNCGGEGGELGAIDDAQFTHIYRD